MKRMPYSEDERRLGLCPLDGQVAVTVAGTRAEVERALGVLMSLWSLRSESTVAWDTMSDGVGADDPLSALVLMRVHDLERAEAQTMDNVQCSGVDSPASHTA